MKKIIAAIAVLSVMATALVSCGGRDMDTTDTTGASSGTTAGTTVTTTVSNGLTT